MDAIGSETLATTLAAVDEGADAIERVAPLVAPQAETPCTEWRAHDLVRHLEVIAGAYLLWTGSSVGGRIGQLRVVGELRTYNARMLQRLPTRPTEHHLARWRDLATDYRRLLVPGFDLPMLQSRTGRVLTVGEYARIAALEWHVHAWDLACAAAMPHDPSPASLAVLASTWRRHVQPQLPAGRPELPAHPTWDDLLRASGRTP